MKHLVASLQAQPVLGELNSLRNQFWTTKSHQLRTYSLYSC